MDFFFISVLFISLQNLKVFFHGFFKSKCLLQGFFLGKFFIQDKKVCEVFLKLATREFYEVFYFLLMTF